MYRSLPNALTIARIAAVPIFAVLLVAEPEGAARAAAFAVFAFAAISDLLDGWLARRFKSESVLGRVLDPIADKLLAGVALLMLVANGTLEGVHVFAAAIILAREILVSGLREFLAALAASDRVAVTQLAKWKTVLQLVAIGVLIMGPGSPATLGPITDIGVGLLWAASALTIWTGTAYVWAGWDLIREHDQVQSTTAPGHQSADGTSDALEPTNRGDI